eukprot:SAG31_NODE_43924_length_265_cov_0.620482_2_plen_78_part_01
MSLESFIRLLSLELPLPRKPHHTLGSKDDLPVSSPSNSSIGTQPANSNASEAAENQTDDRGPAHRLFWFCIHDSAAVW